MLIFVLGYSASGKSEFAEKVCMSLSPNPLYIATMQPFGKEAAQRIKRHRLLRQGKGFDTLEKYTGLDEVVLAKSYKAALLECLPNLLANEIYSQNLEADQAVSKIVKSISHLQQIFKDLVVVSNDIGFDSDNYSKETRLYLEKLGELNRYIARKAGYVVEVVSGLAVYHKGEQKW